MTEKTGRSRVAVPDESAEQAAGVCAAPGRGGESRRSARRRADLGDMCREALGGLRYSPKQTYRWYAKSALAGDANGQNNLGACCAWP